MAATSFLVVSSAKGSARSDLFGEGRCGSESVAGKLRLVPGTVAELIGGDRISRSSVDGVL